MTPLLQRSRAGAARLARAASLVVIATGLGGAALVAVGPAAAQPPAPQAMVKDGHFLMRDGAAIYGGVCAACHMADARGASGSGAYPALAADPRLAASSYPIGVVVHGRKGMPAFGAMLDDEQVAAVVAYVRTHFGNDYPRPVTPAAVKAAR